MCVNDNRIEKIISQTNGQADSAHRDRTLYGWGCRWYLIETGKRDQIFGMLPSPKKSWLLYSYLLLLSKPGKDYGGVLVGGKNRVEDSGDFAAGDDQGQTLNQGHVGNFKGWEAEGMRESQFSVAQEGERQVKSVRRLRLVGTGLSTQAKYLSGARLAKFLIVIAKGAGLWSAASGSWNEIPPIGRLLVGLPGAGITIDNGGPH